LVLWKGLCSSLGWRRWRISSHARSGANGLAQGRCFPFQAAAATWGLKGIENNRKHMRTHQDCNTDSIPKDNLKIARKKMEKSNEHKRKYNLRNHNKERCVKVIKKQSA